MQSKCVMTALLWATTNLATFATERYRTELKPSFSPSTHPGTTTPWDKSHRCSPLHEGQARKDRSSYKATRAGHANHPVWPSMARVRKSFHQFSHMTPKNASSPLLVEKPQGCREKAQHSWQPPEKPPGNGQLSFLQFQPDSHTGHTNFIF